MFQKHSAKKNKGGKKSHNDIVKVYNALKKLEKVLSENPTVMLELSEYLIKENTLSSKPSSCNVCNWVLRWTNILITVTDARGLLYFVSLQLVKNPFLKHCSLLPPSKNMYEQWYRTLTTISQQTVGGNSYKHDDEDEFKIYSVDKHKLKKKPSVSGSSSRGSAPPGRIARGPHFSHVSLRQQRAQKEHSQDEDSFSELFGHDLDLDPVSYQIQEHFDFHGPQEIRFLCGQQEWRAAYGSVGAGGTGQAEATPRAAASGAHK